MINLATPNSAGAMSAVDKAFIDSIPNIYATIQRISEVERTVNEVEKTMNESYTWGEL